MTAEAIFPVIASGKEVIRSSAGIMHNGGVHLMVCLETTRFADFRGGGVIFGLA
jgi:uncharacterized protein YigE (DUF2233 family)